MSEDLRELLEDAGDADISVTLPALKRVLRIDSASGELRPLADFDGLPSRGKVAALALGFRAAVALEVQAADGFTLRDLQRWSGMPSGTLGREARAMVLDRLLSQPERGRYDVPGHSLRRLANLVEGARDGG